MTAPACDLPAKGGATLTSSSRLALQAWSGRRLSQTTCIVELTRHASSWILFETLLEPPWPAVAYCQDCFAGLHMTSCAQAAVHAGMVWALQLLIEGTWPGGARTHWLVLGSSASLQGLTACVVPDQPHQPATADAMRQRALQLIRSHAIRRSSRSVRAASSGSCGAQAASHAQRLADWQHRHRGLLSVLGRRLAALPPSSQVWCGIQALSSSVQRAGRAQSMCRAQSRRPTAAGCTTAPRAASGRGAQGCSRRRAPDAPGRRRRLGRLPAWPWTPAIHAWPLQGPVRAWGQLAVVRDIASGQVRSNLFALWHPAHG